MFKSVDELDQLSFEDCELLSIENAEDGMIFNVEALIIKAGNSQNDNCTDSYAAETSIKFKNAFIDSITKCGYRYFDANGKLIKEEPDREVAKPEWGSMLKKFPGNYLPSIEKAEGFFVIEIEEANEDGVGNSYLIKCKSENVTVSWERYMNRVQR